MSSKGCYFFLFISFTASSLLGHKQSIYSLAMNRSGSLVISGSTEKVWMCVVYSVYCKVL